MESGLFSTSQRVVEQTVFAMVKRRVKIAKLRTEATRLGVEILPEENEILLRLSASQWFPYKHSKN